LRSCPSVDVFSYGSLVGRTDVLPPDLAWRYRIGTQSSSSTASHSVRVVISAPEIPAALRDSLPPLEPVEPGPAVAGERLTLLRGTQATRTRVLAAMHDATTIEFHTHGQLDSERSDVSYLVLADDGTGQYALTAEDLRKQHFAGAPLVVLAACSAAEATPYFYEAWSLPAAFLAAGARAVLASPRPLRAAEAAPFFADVQSRMSRGDPPAIALRDARVEWIKKSPDTSVKDVLLFQ
jgi:hypothetical protein